MDYQSGCDLLSDLPVSIIHIILARVPIRDAVRTSILSRQWRYTWTSLPELVFDYRCANSKALALYGFENFMRKFINSALFHHKGPIQKCKMSCLFNKNCAFIERWILSLSKKDIKELDLYMGCFHSTKWRIRSSIYSCEKLTYLKLDNCKLDPPPSTFKGFLFLRRIVLEDVRISPNAMESLVANSPLLETFELTDDSRSTELRISAPNLKYLYLRGDYIELSVHAPLLAEMWVDLGDENCIYEEHQQQESLVCNYTNFMGGFTNLESLIGDDYFINYLSMGIESCHHTLTFLHLTDIILTEVDLEDIKAISVVARLIIGAPNLQKLKIETYFRDKGDDESEAPHLSFRDFGCAPNFTFEKLRVVKMSNVTRFPLEMEFLEFLLERSPVLETMNLGYLLTEEKQKLVAEIQGFYRASSKAKISFRNF